MRQPTIISFILVLLFQTSIVAQTNHELLNFLKNVEEIAPGKELDKILFSNANRIQLVEQYNRMMLNLSAAENDIDNGAYYWNIEGEPYDDGVKARQFDNEIDELFYVNCRIDLDPNFITLFITESTDPVFTSGCLINYNLNGEILSGIVLFEMERNIPEFKQEKLREEDYHIFTRAKIYSNGIISTLTLADAILKRKYILDETGHFKELAQVYEDFPDNYNDEPIPFLNR